MLIRPTPIGYLGTDDTALELDTFRFETLEIHIYPPQKQLIIAWVIEIRSIALITFTEFCGATKVSIFLEKFRKTHSY